MRMRLMTGIVGLLAATFEALVAVPDAGSGSLCKAPSNAHKYINIIAARSLSPTKLVECMQPAH